MIARVLALGALLIALAVAPADAMQKRSANATDTRGNVLAGTTVTVRTLAGDMATIYSDNAGTVKANPITVDPANGLYTYYAANGRYTETLALAGHTFDVAQSSDVLLYDPAITGAEFSATQLLVTGPADPSIPYQTTPSVLYRGVVGIGTLLDSVPLSVNAASYSAGTSTGVRIAPSMFPSWGAGVGAVGGDARALFVSPTITINPNSLGFTSGTNTHKWIASGWIEGPNIPASAGLPQEIAILRLGPSGTASAPDLTQASAGLGVSALRIQGNLPNKIDGAIFLDVSGSGAIQNIHIGLQDGTPGDGEWHANALRIASKIAPLGDGTKNAGGEGFTARIGGSIITDTSGTHENIGTLDVRTPTIATAGAATVIDFSTLKVGDAPTGGTTNRALLVGTGLSQIKGDLALGTNANKQRLTVKTLTELTTIAAAATTDTTIQMPAGAVILAVSVRTTVVIPTAATYTVGDSGSATRFSTAAVGVAAGSTDPGTAAGAYYNAGALSVRITPNAPPADNTGRVRVTIYFYSVDPPTT